MSSKILTTDNPTPLVTAETKKIYLSQKQLAWRDVIAGIKQWRMWFMLAYQDIRLRYRRSTLGPFWITLSMAITAYSMGFLYGHLFQTDINQYCPFLVASILTWSLISNIIIDQTDTFMTSALLMKQIKLPLTSYIHRVNARNMLIFFHNVIVMVPIYFIFYQTAQINLNTLLLIPSLLLIYLTACIFGLVLAIIGARYRDISQMVKSLVQVIFFVTPVMWNPSILPKKFHTLIYFNPFYSFMELIRQPLLGAAPTQYNYLVVFITMGLGLLACSLLFCKYRSRIIYWL